jgi:hypothetical protein
LLARRFAELRKDRLPSLLYSLGDLLLEERGINSRLGPEPPERFPDYLFVCLINFHIVPNLLTAKYI